MVKIKTSVRRPFGGSKYPDKKRINLYADNSGKGQGIRKMAVFAAALTCTAAFINIFVVIPLRQTERAERTYRNMTEQLDSLKEKNRIAEEVMKEYAHYGDGYLNAREKALPDRIMMLEVLETYAAPYCEAISAVSVIEDRIEAVCTLSSGIRSSELLNSLEKSENVRYVSILHEAVTEGGKEPIPAKERITAVSMAIYFEAEEGTEE